MGLLGDSWNDPKTMAVLQMAGGLLSGGNFGQALSRGVGAYSDEMARSTELQRRKDESELLQMQRAATLQQALAQQQREKAKQEFLAGQYLPGQTNVQLDTSEGIPMASKPPVITQTPGTGFDVAGALRAGFTPEEIKNYVGLQDVGRQEIAQWQEIEGPNGAKLKQGYDRFGRAVGQPVMAYTAPVQVDTGRGIQFVSPRAGIQLEKQPTFADQISMGNLGIAQQRLRMDQEKEQKPQFNADVGGWLIPPSKDNPQGAVIPVSSDGGTLKPPTEGQGKAVLFGTRMAQSNAILGDLEAKGYTTPSYLKGAAESVPFVGQALGRAASMTPFVSPQEQQVEQARRDFINAVLRRESGAVISPEEFDNAAKQYFPQFGDSKEVMQQKKENRETAIKGIAYEAGPHGRVINKLMQSGGMDQMPKADMSNRGKVLVDKQTGKRYMSNGMSWMEQ